MGIAELDDRFKYLEDRVKEMGGPYHLKESNDWKKIGGEMEKNIDFLDVYIHRSQFFKASVHYIGEDRNKVGSIDVTFTKPKAHIEEDGEPMPPIYENGPDREEYTKQLQEDDKE